ncbi:protein kinase [Sorangium sp. So ce260]|uniref:serine/threonine-protein kinase n=1 Tax=Sorangium sp. So ce260 TaxID=3133291 RepID=UPI003F5F7364
MGSEHVVRVLDVGTLDTGAPYMVLEHLVGEDLSDVLRARGALPVSEAADYGLQICEALAEAHARGIIHRDLKPKNLFLTQRADGSSLVKVLDFGLSKMLLAGAESVHEASLTATGVIMGSVHYMSPEQLRSLKHTDVRTDIWALGVTLYRMLTARMPFEGDEFMAVIASILTDAPLPMSVHRWDVPLRIERAVARCLEKDSAQRTQSVTELARSLVPFAGARGQLLFESIARLQPEAAAPALHDAVHVRLPPGSGTDIPAIIAAQPASVAAQPASVAAQPASVAAQPASVAAQPASVAAQPASVAAQPASMPAGFAAAAVRVEKTATLKSDSLAPAQRRGAARATAPLIAAGAGILMAGAAALAWVLSERSPAAATPAAATSYVPSEPAASSPRPATTFTIDLPGKDSVGRRTIVVPSTFPFPFPSPSESTPSGRQRAPAGTTPSGETAPKLP